MSRRNQTWGMVDTEVPGPLLPSHRDASALNRSHSNSRVFTATARLLPRWVAAPTPRLLRRYQAKKIDRLSNNQADPFAVSYDGFQMSLL